MDKSKVNKTSKRTVLITGATGGIGKETAIRFAQEGWNIIGHYFSSEEKAKQLKKAIDKFKVNCHLFKVDFSSKKEVHSFVDRIKKFNIDSLINNAGTYILSRHFTKLTIDDITDTFMVNAFTPILLAAHIFTQMRKRHFGRVVNISSVAAKYGGSSNSLHYGCSKLALEGLTKVLAKEGAQYNLLVNTIRPGVIDTEFHQRFPKDMKKRISMIPLRRMGRAADIAEMAFYLGSDKNNFITNEVITISGGE